ncbi:hypothetical protein [Streptomyces sp. NPDC059122]|uniref:hypothetical protein n=1 Tax=Streptomyces sp. NPDC059122 TaxID=3346732 RepID=UPI0036749521
MAALLRLVARGSVAVETAGRFDHTMEIEVAVDTAAHIAEPARLADHAAVVADTVTAVRPLSATGASRNLGRPGEAASTTAGDHHHEPVAGLDLQLCAVRIRPCRSR